jgi:hypothetical protein
MILVTSIVVAVILIVIFVWLLYCYINSRVPTNYRRNTNLGDCNWCRHRWLSRCRINGNVRIEDTYYCDEYLLD